MRPVPVLLLCIPGVAQIVDLPFQVAEHLKANFDWTVKNKVTRIVRKACFDIGKCFNQLNTQGRLLDHSFLNLSKQTSSLRSHGNLQSPALQSEFGAFQTKLEQFVQYELNPTRRPRISSEEIAELFSDRIGSSSEFVPNDAQILCRKKISELREIVGSLHQIAPTLATNLDFCRYMCVSHMMTLVVLPLILVACHVALTVVLAIILFALILSIGRYISFSVYHEQLRDLIDSCIYHGNIIL